MSNPDFISQVRSATYRVDLGREHIGSAFWISDKLLLTANHVAETSEQGNLNVVCNDGEISPVDIYHQDSGADLALLKVSNGEYEDEYLTLDPRIPEIGKELFWTGYARLFGERKIERQRFGWGRVASKKYENRGGIFYEVDGLFNPAHSGGPVVNPVTETVVGVVSASAGGFERLEENWEQKVDQLTGIFQIQSEIGSGFSRAWNSSDPEEISQIRHNKQVFERFGLQPKFKENDDGSMELELFPDQIPLRAGQVQAEISQLLLKTAQETFQMGVGIATGGEPLGDLKEFV